MGFLNFLQAAPADSLNQIQAELAAVAEKIATTPTNELIGDFLEKAINFGIKVLAAILIYLIGAWLIKKIKGMLKRIFDKKGTEAPLTEKIIFLVLYIAGGLVGLTGPKEILPIIAAVFYMFAMFQKDPQKIRYILLGNMSSWVIYFIAPFSTSIFAQIAGIISSLIGILRYRKKQRVN